MPRAKLGADEREEAAVAAYAAVGLEPEQESLDVFSAGACYIFAAAVGAFSQ